MTFLIDPPLVRILITRLKVAADASLSEAAQLKRPLTVVGGDSAIPARLRQLADDYGHAADLLRLVLVTLDAAEIAAGDLQRASELDSNEASDILAVLAAAGITDPNEIVAILLAVGPGATADDVEAHIVDNPRSARDVLIGLPPEGEDPSLDGAIDRLDDRLLEALAAGESIDPGQLTEGEQADLRLLAGALGGGEITITRTRTEKYAGAGGDDTYRKVTEEIPLAESEIDLVARFVDANLEARHDLRRGIAVVNRLSGGDPSEADPAAVAAELGVSEDRADSIIAAAVDVSAIDQGTGDDDNDDRLPFDFDEPIDLDGIESETEEQKRQLKDIIDEYLEREDVPDRIREELEEKRRRSFPDGGGGSGESGGGYDDGWGGGYGTENDGDYDNNYSGI